MFPFTINYMEIVNVIGARSVPVYYIRTYALLLITIRKLFITIAEPSQ